MVTISQLRKLALSFPAVTEEPHFEKLSFRVMGKIFVTCDEKNKNACIKLSEIDQDVFTAAGRSNIYPVPNKWGKQGWTIIDLKKVDMNLFKDALKTAYCKVAPRKLGDQILAKEDS
jgi:predicted DNA-binding protein (MmcQ/YjbR family)